MLDTLTPVAHTTDAREALQQLDDYIESHPWLDAYRDVAEAVWSAGFLAGQKDASEVMLESFKRSSKELIDIACGDAR